MANHGYLPPNGLDISYDMINQAAMEAYNYADGVFLTAFLFANETFQLSTTGDTLTINLLDLARHGAIEQDGSMTRNDIYIGDDYHFDATVFAPVAKDLHLDDPSFVITPDVVAKARANRQAAAIAENQMFNQTSAQITGSLGTNGLWLTTMWDFSKKGARTAWVQAFLGMCSILREKEC